MESKGIAERVMAKPKRSRLAWVFGGTLMQFPGRLGDLGFGLALKQLLPNYVVRPERAPKRFNIYYSSKRAWRGTNRSVKALGDDYLGTMSLDAPVLIVQGEQDVIRETNAVLAARRPCACSMSRNDGPGSGSSRPALRPALPRPTRSASRRSVLRPAAAHTYAVAAPLRPAPMMTTSNV